jgi:LysM repeat protein
MQLPVRGSYSVKRTPPWLMDRIVHRIGPPPKKERGCRLPVVFLLGVLLLLFVCGVILFWTGHGLELSPGKPLANDGSESPISPSARTSPTVVPIVPAPTSLTPAGILTPVQPAASPTPLKYRVAPGDTLGGIAIKHGVSVDAIMSANGLKSNIIHVGDELVIPLPTPSPSK